MVDAAEVGSGFDGSVDAVIVWVGRQFIVSGRASSDLLVLAKTFRIGDLVP